MSDFRNYSYQFIEFDSNLNILIGDNAQGKTNILESIYLLITLQSFRPTENKHLIQWDKPVAHIEGILKEEDFERSQKLVIEEQGKKAYISGKFVKKSDEYLSKSTAIAFSPLDLQIVQSSPQLRRRYLDHAILITEATYGAIMGEYYRALIQRNAALRLEKEDMVSIWGEKVVQLGAKVLLKRLQFIAKLNTLTPGLYREISGGNDELELRYEMGSFLNHFKEIEQKISEEMLREFLAQKQKESLRQERVLKRTLVGPHRDDFTAWVNGENLRTYGSQGEQRSVILSLKLSELVNLEQEKKQKAIFLLDDIASELDDTRKHFLFHILEGKKTQVFVTTTDLHSLKLESRDQKIFRVTNGEVQLEK